MKLRTYYYLDGNTISIEHCELLDYKWIYGDLKEVFFKQNKDYTWTQITKKL